MCDVDKSTLAGVAVQLHGISLPWQSEVGSHPLATGQVVASDDQIEMLVVVVIEEPGWEAPLGLLDAELGRHFLERSVAPVMIETVVHSIFQDEQLRVAVFILVS